MNRQTFSSLFKVGEEINSGGPSERANAARLEIIAIEDSGIRYKSVNATSSKLLPYTTLAVLIAGFDRIDSNAIQRTIQPVYLDAGLKQNEFTENYEYGFARELLRRREKFALYQKKSV